MTGWQGNEGQYGGGQGSNAPEPYGGQPQYGPGPGNPDAYNPDPYGAPPHYGADPYGQYVQYGGYPGAGFDPPPPPKRSKAPVVVSLIAILAIVGTVVTIVLLNKESGTPTAGSGISTSTKPSARSSTPTARSSTPRTSANPEPKDGWITIDNSADAGLTYQVPQDWKPSPTKRPSGVTGVDFSGAAESGSYSCGGGTYIRGFAVSGDVQAKGGAGINLNATVADFAKSFGVTYYGAKSKVDVPAPKPTTVDGNQAAVTVAKVTAEVAREGCDATTGEVAVVGVLLKASGKPDGVAMLVVVNDLQGGPASPKPIPDSVVQEILTTVRVA